jgi:hypothetical protein
VQHRRCSNGSITLKGLAFEQYAPGSGVIVTITDNGQEVYQAPATMPRPDVNKVYRISGNHGFAYVLAWTGGFHKYCVRATQVGAHVGTDLGCVTWTTRPA